MTSLLSRWQSCFPALAAIVAATSLAWGETQSPYCESETDFVFTANQGAWETTQRTTMRFLLDQPAQRLRVEHPAATVVVRDGRLTATFPMADGYVLERPLADLNYAALVEAVPVLTEPAMIKLAQWTADDWVAALAGGPATLDRGADGSATLSLPAGTLKLDADGGGATIELPDQQFDPGPASFRYDWDVAEPSQAFAEDAFELDTQGRQSVDSMQALMQAMQGGGGGAAANQGEGSPLVGQDAPDFTLARLEGGDEVTLSDLDQRVVVLDFWATWCPPCVEGLPKVQAVHDWAQAAGLPVEVFAVNLQETPDQVRQFLDNHDLDLPVLMDQQGAASDAYGVQAIPTTVIIAYGQVKNVHVGLTPDLEAALKAEIEAAVRQDTAG